jgi:aminomethyltransferase
MALKKTPLYEKHTEMGGRIIDFGGWALPVRYDGIVKEHRRVREAAGLFDVSHMGEVAVQGPDAQGIIQNLITNDITNMETGQTLYSPVCYPDGGTVDDLLVYKLAGDDYLLVVNAANTDKDFEWMFENMKGDAAIRNISDEIAQLAVQGPKAEEILQRLTDFPLDSIKFYHFAPNVQVGGATAIVSRTGYTGEDGFEIYCPASGAPGLWDELLREGEPMGLAPAGLGARDTLRFEAALPLYGHELSKDISPLEAGLGFFVKLNKESFIGKQALAKQKEEGVARRIAGFEMKEPGIPRAGYGVFSAGRKIGVVTSGGYAPSLDKNLGLALVETDCAAVGTGISIEVRGKQLRAEVVKKPFYQKKYKK